MSPLKLLSVSLISIVIAYPLSAQWVEQPLPPMPEGYQIWKVRFLNESTGWMLGDSYVSDSGSVFMTQDGGLSWTLQDSWYGNGFGALQILNDSTVMYSRGRIVYPYISELRRTSDAGL